MQELIDKYQKELDFLNKRLATALFMGKTTKAIINAEKVIYEKIISDLKNL